MKKILVIFRGSSSESYISKKNSTAISATLEKLRSLYKFSTVELNKNIAEEILKYKPDVVFNMVHGKYGEDGRIQALLDILEVPYTHPSMFPSFIGINKFLSKILVSYYGVSVPECVVIEKNLTIAETRKKMEHIKVPFIIKPIDEGRSIGTVIVRDNDFSFDNYDWRDCKKVLIEKYIHGTEFTVGVVDDFVFDAIEIKPLDKFYDLSAKDNDSKVNYIIPPDSLKEEKHNELKLLALKIHKILECNVISRSDFILNNEDNKFYYLETNTSPGLVVPHSLIPISLKHHGFTMEDLCIFLIENAQYEGMKNKKHFKFKHIEYEDIKQIIKRHEEYKS